MGKITGMILIMAGCAGTLGYWYETKKKELSMMEECIRLFSHWQDALETEHMRLYDFLDTYPALTEEMPAMLKELKNMLEKNCYPTGRKAWDRVLEKNRKSLLLGEETKQIFRNAGEAFFCESSRESMRISRVCIRRMEKILALKREELRRKCRVYLPAGMLLGVMIIILLL